TLDVEAEAGNRQAREDELRGFAREAFETSLCVEHGIKEEPSHERIVGAAHHVAREEVGKEGGAHDVARLAERTAGDRAGVPFLQRVDDRIDLFGRIRQISICEYTQRTGGGEHPAGDRET